MFVSSSVVSLLSHTFPPFLCLHYNNNLLHVYGVYPNTSWCNAPIEPFLCVHSHPLTHKVGAMDICAGLKITRQHVLISWRCIQMLLTL